MESSAARKSVEISSEALPTSDARLANRINFYRPPEAAGATAFGEQRTRTHLHTACTHLHTLAHSGHTVETLERSGQRAKSLRSQSRHWSAAPGGAILFRANFEPRRAIERRCKPAEDAARCSSTCNIRLHTDTHTAHTERLCTLAPAGSLQARSRRPSSI